MDARLPAAVIAGGLMRRAEGEGGFAAVLAKGDARAGAILVVLVGRDGAEAAYERVLAADGGYRWQAVAGLAGCDLGGLVARRRRFDPDLWVIELNVASVERFAAGMNDAD